MSVDNYVLESWLFLNYNFLRNVGNYHYSWRRIFNCIRSDHGRWSWFRNVRPLSLKKELKLVTLKSKLLGTLFGQGGMSWLLFDHFSYFLKRRMLMENGEHCIMRMWVSATIWCRPCSWFNGIHVRETRSARMNLIGNPNGRKLQWFWACRLDWLIL